MTSYLLEIFNFGKGQPGHTPLFLEIPVDSRLGPLLISATRDFRWVSHAKNNLQRVALQPNRDISDVFREVVAAVKEEGERNEWGNVHSLTPQGVGACVRHLHDFGFHDITYLVAQDVPLPVMGIPKEHAVVVSWLDPSTVVVVPKDRSFVGSIGLYDDQKYFILLVQNASRGMAIAS